MPKINKNKQQLIMDVALVLFYKYGYNDTSVEAIVKKAGVSKGAFYYYFDSKDAILEQITTEFIDQSARTIENIADDKKLNALEKFQKTMRWPNNISDLKKINLKKFIKLGQLIALIDSAKLFNKIQNYTVAKLSPPLLKIFKQGVKENIFNIAYPEETCKLYIEFLSNFKRRMFFEVKECKISSDRIILINNKIKFLENFIARILGLKNQSISLNPQGIDLIKKILINQ